MGARVSSPSAPDDRPAALGQADNSIYAAALQVNSTISNSSIGRAVTGQCGANFGANITGVSAPSSNNASASASAAAATPSATGAAGALTFSAGALVAAALAVVAL